jgi:hypothetical protein
MSAFADGSGQGEVPWAHWNPATRLRTLKCFGRRMPYGRRVRAGGLCAVLAAVSTAWDEAGVAHARVGAIRSAVGPSGPAVRLRTCRYFGRRMPYGRRVRAGGLCAVLAAVSTAWDEAGWSRVLGWIAARSPRHITGGDGTSPAAPVRCSQLKPHAVCEAFRRCCGGRRLQPLRAELCRRGPLHRIIPPSRRPDAARCAGRGR